MYIFGDSTADADNNVHITGSMTANFLPYGIDFGPAGNTPTGRYCNGKTAADFLAEHYGLSFAPAYLSMTPDQKMSNRVGVNYASSGCGILRTAKPFFKLNDSAITLNCLNLDTQIQYFKDTVPDVLPSVFKVDVSLKNHLKWALMYFSVGANDFFFSYEKLGESPDAFAKKILVGLESSVRELYGLGARVFLFNNIAPLGCIPQNVDASGNCKEEMNAQLQLYTESLPGFVRGLWDDYQDGYFFLGDGHAYAIQVLKKGITGITSVTGACCGTWNSDNELMCNLSDTLCPSRSVYRFFDGAHTTETTNRIINHLN